MVLFLQVLAEDVALFAAFQVADAHPVLFGEAVLEFSVELEGRRANVRLSWTQRHRLDLVDAEQFLALFREHDWIAAQIHRRVDFRTRLQLDLSLIHI